MEVARELLNDCMTRLGMSTIPSGNSVVVHLPLLTSIVPVIFAPFLRFLPDFLGKLLSFFPQAFF